MMFYKHNTNIYHTLYRAYPTFDGFESLLIEEAMHDIPISSPYHHRHTIQNHLGYTISHKLVKWWCVLQTHNELQCMWPCCGHFESVTPRTILVIGSDQRLLHRSSNCESRGLPLSRLKNWS